MRISWRSPIASSGTATAGARTVRTKIRMPFKSLSLPAFAFVLLSGANAEAAAPWLQMARERLAVETALAHIQELLIAHLTRPSETPASPRTPS